MINVDVDIFNKEEDKIVIEGELDTILSELIQINYSIIRALITNEHDLELAVADFTEKLNDKEVMKQFRNVFKIDNIENNGGNVA